MEGKRKSLCVRPNAKYSTLQVTQFRNGLRRHSDSRRTVVLPSDSAGILTEKGEHGRKLWGLSTRLLK